MAATRKSNAPTRIKKAATSTKKAGGGIMKAATGEKTATRTKMANHFSTTAKPALRRRTHGMTTQSQMQAPRKPGLAFGARQEKQYNISWAPQETNRAVTHTYVLDSDQVSTLRWSWLRTRPAEREHFVWRWMAANFHKFERQRGQPLLDGFETTAVTFEAARSSARGRTRCASSARRRCKTPGTVPLRRAMTKEEEDGSDGGSEASNEENAAWLEKCRFDSEVVPYVNGRCRYVAYVGVERRTNRHGHRRSETARKSRNLWHDAPLRHRYYK
jgi:hypothetical protein